MTVDLVALVLDATAPDELARFWAEALGWGMRPREEGAMEVVATDATRFSLLVRPGASEKVGQNRIHFDLTTASAADQDDSVADLLAMGARHVDIGQGPDETHVVLADPEGNELCVLAPFNRFLAGCPRLGAVNCDGTRDLGCFFSQALGWPLVWDQDEETAVQAPDGTGPKITWSGPPLMPKLGRARFHFHLAPASGTTTQDAVDDLLALGAARLVDGDGDGDGDGESHGCAGAIPLADVDGNGFCLMAR